VAESEGTYESVSSTNPKVLRRNESQDLEIRDTLAYLWLAYVSVRQQVLVVRYRFDPTKIRQMRAPDQIGGRLCRAR
jgi:hypothetical protein